MEVVRDSSAVQRLFFPTCWSRVTSESSAYGKQRICGCNSASTHFHVLWLSDFIFYPKPLYKSLHQSFFYSFITILPSESGVTLHSIYAVRRQRNLGLIFPIYSTKSFMSYFYANKGYHSQALVSFKKYMPPPLPYFKVNICPFLLPRFGSILN